MEKLCEVGFKNATKKSVALNQQKKRKERKTVGNCQKAGSWRSHCSGVKIRGGKVWKCTLARPCVGRERAWEGRVPDGCGLGFNLLG